MKVLVTGGAGFVGSHICDALLEVGHEVYSFDNRAAGVNFTPNAVASLKQNICNLTASDMPEGLDFVVHAAARADVSANWDNPKERRTLHETNVEGTQAVLEATRGVPMALISTLAVYGDCRDCREYDACIATSPYAASKLAGEALLQAYAFEAKTPWWVFRLGCVVGARYHHGHVADFVHAAKKNGCVEAKSDGLTKKSMVHVTDVAAAVCMAVRGEDALSRGVYNTASGTWSPRDTIRVMRLDDKTKWPENKTHGWVGDPMAVADSLRLRGAGWFPRFSLEQGVREACEGLGYAIG